MFSIFFSLDGLIAYRGCISDSPLSLGKQFCDKNKNQCDACETRGCNNRDVKWNDQQSCIKCNSKENEYCGRSPSNVTKKNCSRTTEGYSNQCFTVSKNGSVARGCFSDATPEVAENCQSGSKNCKLCGEKDCNSEPIKSNEDDDIVIEPRPYWEWGKARAVTECFICNSQQNEACISKPNSLGGTKCKTENDICFTHVKNKIVFRGCLNDSIAAGSENLKEDCKDKDICEVCDGTNCNRKPIENESCIACSSTSDVNCRENANATMQVTCDIAVRTMGCYHSTQNSKVERGCVSSLSPADRNVCRSEGDQCKTCISSACNVKSKFQTCVDCNEQNADCFWNPLNVRPVTCKNYLDQCFIHVEGKKIQRGCLKEKENMVEKCKNKELCEVCGSGELCNNKVISKSQCFTCNSKDDPKCADNVQEYHIKECAASIQPIGCYHLLEGNVTVRGCISELKEPTSKICRENSGKCKSCLSSNCNDKKAFQSCVICNSTIDANCTSSVESIKASTCKEYEDNCFTHISNEDIVSRGCTKDVENIHDTCRSDFDKCSICPSDSCNNKNIVKNETCAVCDSNPKCFTAEVEAQICPPTVRSSGCYRFENETVHHVKRGCVAQLPVEDRLNCRSQNETCKTCQGNGCNMKQSFTKCHVCDSRNDPKCATDFLEKVEVKTCKLYNDECFTSITDGNVVQRGCLNEMTNNFIQECEKDYLNCRTCVNNYTACNTHKPVEEQCIDCDSRIDEYCKNYPDLIDPTKCGKGLTLTPQGCFLNTTNGGIKRGCVIDITDVKQKKKCLSNSKKCKVCAGDSCNKKEAFQTCYQCDSATDKNCVPAKQSAFVTCQNYTEKCMILLNSTGTIRRDCESFIDHFEGITQQHVCEDDRCNGEIFPQDRLTCAQCNGETVCQNSTTNNFPRYQQFCQKYVKKDECFTALGQGK